MKFMKKIAAMAAATAVAAVSLVSMGSMGASATDEPPYTAYLCISAGGDAQWKAGDWETESATITGDGVYSTSVTIPEDKGSETIEFLMLSTDINAGGGTATTDPASTTEAPKNTDPNGTTADPSKTTAAGETTTTAAGGSNGGNNSSNGGSSNGGSSNGSSSGSSNGSTNNATTSQTGDFGIAAVVLGAVATAALGAGAYTITRKKK